MFLRVAEPAHSARHRVWHILGTMGYRPDTFPANALAKLISPTVQEHVGPTGNQQKCLMWYMFQRGLKTPGTSCMKRKTKQNSVFLKLTEAFGTFVCSLIHTSTELNSIQSSIQVLHSDALKSFPIYLNPFKSTQIKSINSSPWKSLQSNPNLANPFKWVKALQMHSSPFKSIQTNASLFKTAQVHPNPFKSDEIHSNPFKCVQIDSILFKSVQIRSNPKREHKSVQIK